MTLDDVKNFMDKILQEESIEDYIEAVNEVKYLLNNMVKNYTLDDEVFEFVEVMVDLKSLLREAILDERYEDCMMIENYIILEKFGMAKYLKIQQKMDTEVLKLMYYKSLELANLKFEEKLK